MSATNVLIRHCQFVTRPLRRDISYTSSKKTSTSPQRRSVPVPEASDPRPFNEIPGPIAMPMLRHSAHVLPRIGNFHHTVGLGLLEGLQSKYGDLVRLAKGTRKRPVLYVFNVELMRQVYDSNLTDPPRWEKSPLSRYRSDKQCPINTDESKAIWAALRSLLQDNHILKNYDEALNNVAEDATRRLGDLRLADNALNEELETELFRWALETLGVIFLGQRLGCLDGPVHVPTPENRPAEKTSLDDDVQEICSLSKRNFSELTPAEKLIRCSLELAKCNYLVRSEKTLKTDTEIFNNALQTFDRHFSIVEEFLNSALEDLVKSGMTKPEQILLDKLKPLNKRLLPLVSDMLLAGSDPLAQSALDMLYQLSIHAAQQQRAQDELSWAAASVDAGAGHPGLSYVAACAREAMRLHPATGGVVRRLREDMVLDGFEVPAGVDIVLAHGVSSKCDQHWRRPNSFIPDRWCSEGWQPLRASVHTIASKPFGEACPAEGLVGNVLTALTSKVLEKYRLEWHGPVPKMTLSGVNRIEPPFYFVLEKAC